MPDRISPRAGKEKTKNAAYNFAPIVIIFLNPRYLACAARTFELRIALVACLRLFDPPGNEKLNSSVQKIVFSFP
jgi:hypothetical protein